MYYITATPMIMFKNTVHPVMALAHWLSTACGDLGWLERNAHALEDFVISLHFTEACVFKEYSALFVELVARKNNLIFKFANFFYTVREEKTNNHYNKLHLLHFKATPTA